MSRAIKEKFTRSLSQDKILYFAKIFKLYDEFIVFYAETFKKARKRKWFKNRFIKPEYLKLDEAWLTTYYHYLSFDLAQIFFE